MLPGVYTHSYIIYLGMLMTIMREFENRDNPNYLAPRAWEGWKCNLLIIFMNHEYARSICYMYAACRNPNIYNIIKQSDSK